MAKTPLMDQYKEIKEGYKDCLLFYRLGDFYELFYDDAYTASHELELTLTGKNAGAEGRVPMCGVPYHAAEVYIYRLIQKGYKVAICEQLEDPRRQRDSLSAMSSASLRREPFSLKMPLRINPTTIWPVCLRKTRRSIWSSVIFQQAKAGGGSGI